MFTRSNPPSRPAIPFGHRVYAIGDVHGEAGLLHRLLEQIEEDNGAHRQAIVTVVLLGDIIDRGPDAAALLETFARLNIDRVVVLKGNHEEALAQAWHGDDEVLDAWMPFGAMTTLTGFGVTLREIDSSNTAFTAALHARVPPELIAWIEALPSAWTCGGYHFVHAGVRPGVDLADQADADLRWIREPFLSSRRDHGKVIVHGHTVEPGVPALGGNRIGIDTGAHEHGVLTALGLEGERQWLLQVSATDAARDAAETAEAVLPSPAHDDAPPLRDIAALLAAIVTPRPPRRDGPLLLTAGRKLVDRLPSRKRLGNRGVAVAGFALVLASLGGVFAVRTIVSRTGSNGIAVAIPDGQPTRAVAPLAHVAAGDAPRAQPTGGTRPPRRSVRPAAARTLPPVAADKASPRLSGKALERALEEDRVTTRGLNLDELSRQQGRNGR